MAAVLSADRPGGGWAGTDAGDGPDGGGAMAPKVAAERSEFLLQCNVIRLRRRLSWKQWALEHAGCSPQEWSRFWNLDRRLSKRVEERLLVLYPELRKPWLRGLNAAPAARGSVGPDPGG
jgi:hypothetical protein